MHSKRPHYQLTFLCAAFLLPVLSKQNKLSHGTHLFTVYTVLLSFPAEIRRLSYLYFGLTL